MAVCVCVSAPSATIRPTTFTQQGHFNSLLSKTLLMSVAPRPSFFLSPCTSPTFTQSRLKDKREMGLFMTYAAHQINCCQLLCKFSANVFHSFQLCIRLTGALTQTDLFIYLFEKAENTQGCIHTRTSTNPHIIHSWVI